MPVSLAKGLHDEGLCDGPYTERFQTCFYHFPSCTPGALVQALSLKL